MAFQAHRENHWAAQKPRIWRSMRIMADLAALYPDRWMFVYEGPTLFFVALQTRLLIGQRLIHHVMPVRYPPCRRERPVRIMAVGARHDAFIHAVLEGHRKLRADVGVASITKLPL